MQALQSNASDLSGVAQGDAFKIDEVNLFERLGKEVFVKLSTNFYNRVYADSEQWFVDIFAGKPKEASIQNQYEFFIQRMGGPALYSERKGHPALIGRHMEFNISKQSAERWIEIMEKAMDDTPEIDPDSRMRMMNFLKHTAYFIYLGVNRNK